MLSDKKVPLALAVPLAYLCKKTQAQWSFEDIQEQDLLTVHEIEKTAYSFPWSSQAFQDCLTCAYWMKKLMTVKVPTPGEKVKDNSSPTRHSVPGSIEAYIVAMQNYDEVHLLNITVKPDMQKKGVGRYLLHQLTQWAVSQKAQSIWLEVRASNASAIALYASYGFIQKGRRKNYYPDAAGQREDAIVMSLSLQELICA